MLLLCTPAVTKACKEARSERPDLQLVEVLEIQIVDSHVVRPTLDRLV